MAKPFDIEIEFKGHKLYVDGTKYEYMDGLKLTHVYLSGTDIEISDKLSTDTHEELCDLIIKTIL